MQFNLHDWIATDKLQLQHHLLPQLGNSASRNRHFVLERFRKWVLLPIRGSSVDMWQFPAGNSSLNIIRCPFHRRVIAVVRKRPRPFCQNADGRLHLNTHAPLTPRSRSGLAMPLSRHSVGTYQETSSHATRQGTLSHSRHCGLILA